MEIEDWVVIGILTSVTITWFILFIIFMVKRKKNEVPTKPKPKSSIKTKSSPTPVSSPIVSRLNFSQVKVIDGNGTSFYYMSEGYLSFRQLKDMSQWGIDKPLNYTHAKINNLIFKFINPNSTDSSGFIVDEFGNKIENQPASQFSSKLEFGFFI